MTTPVNTINWFEIPVLDYDRAKKFYETILDIKMEDAEVMGMQMAYFPYVQKSGKVSGGLVKSQYHKPSMDGVRIFLNGNPDLSVVLSRVETAGGKILMAKTNVGEGIGRMAFFIDTEGNNIALHSNN